MYKLHILAHVICLLQNPHRTVKGIRYVVIEPEFFAVVFFGSQLPPNLDWQALYTLTQRKERVRESHTDCDNWGGEDVGVEEDDRYLGFIG